MNYYELFRYKKADGGRYSDIDVSNIDARYRMMLNAIKDQKSLVRSDSKEFASLSEAEEALKTAYSVLSDKTKRAEYDASLTSKKGGGSISRKVAAVALVAVMATATLGGCSENKTKNNEPAPIETVNPVDEESQEATIIVEEATEAPVVTETPAATETPEVTETPAATETPEATETPAPTQDPRVRDDVEDLGDRRHNRPWSLLLQRWLAVN